MTKYILETDAIDGGPVCFSAENDEEAELYVETNYKDDDGPMHLYRLVAVTDWP